MSLQSIIKLLTKISQSYFITARTITTISQVFIYTLLSFIVISSILFLTITLLNFVFPSTNSLFAIDSFLPLSEVEVLKIFKSNANTKIPSSTLSDTSLDAIIEKLNENNDVTIDVDNIENYYKTLDFNTLIATTTDTSSNNLVEDTSGILADKHQLVQNVEVNNTEIDSAFLAREFATNDIITRVLTGPDYIKIIPSPRTAQEEAERLKAIYDVIYGDVRYVAEINGCVKNPSK